MTNVISLNKAEPARTAGRNAILASLDIGSSKISCVIAEYKAGTTAPFRVLGHSQTASRGVQAGAISSIDEAEKAIRIAVDAAEKAAQTTVSHVQVGVTGGKPLSLSYRGVAQIRSGEVQSTDVDKAISAAVSQAVVGRRSVLGVSPQTFELDGVAMVNPPVGLSGRQLAVTASLVTVDAPYLLNLASAVERAHLVPDGFVLAANAAGRVCLEADEREIGVAIIDIGHSVTSYGVFRKGHLRHAGAIPVAGHHITLDVARAFSSSITSAERLKTLHGNVLGFGDDERDVLAVPLLGEKGLDSIQQIPKSRLTAVIRPRVEEILEMTAQALVKSGEEISKVVLTGGSSSLVGLRELARPVFACDARLGHIPDLPGLPDRMRQPSLAAALGLISHAIRPDPWCALPSEASAAIERQQSGPLRRVGRWLLESF